MGVFVRSCFPCVGCKAFGLRARHQMEREAPSVLAQGEIRSTWVCLCLSTGTNVLATAGFSESKLLRSKPRTD